jgi:D-alanine transaminase
MTVYFNGEFVDKDDVSLSPDDRGFVFADGIYEVLRAENGAFFQEDLHFGAEPARNRPDGSRR